jgi:hypothetical protein
MVFALVFLSPMVLVAALVLALACRKYGPDGISYFLWVPLLGAGMMGALAATFSIMMLGVDGAHAQKRLLGRQYAGVLQLRYYDHSEFPDPGQEWRYRIDQETIARLRPICRKQTRTPAGTCSLYEEQDDRVAIFVTLEGDELIVGDWTL